MYRQHLESLRKKLTSRVALLKRLAGSGWGARATTLWIAILPPVHSTAEYCTPVWCRSIHTRLIDPVTINALISATGCLHPTPADNLPILAGIQPAEHHHKGTTLSSMLCHGKWTSAPLSAQQVTEWERTAFKIKTTICTRRTTTHQFIWQ